MDQLQRLIEIDAALASKAGLPVTDFCERIGITSRTLKRDFARLKKLGCRMECERVGDTESGNGRGTPGTHYVWRYTGKQRLFYPWVS